MFELPSFEYCLRIDEEKSAYKTSKKTWGFSIARRQQTYYISKRTA